MAAASGAQKCKHAALSRKRFPVKVVLELVLEGTKFSWGLGEIEAGREWSRDFGLVHSPLLFGLSLLARVLDQLLRLSRACFGSHNRGPVGHGRGCQAARRQVYSY